MPSKNYLGNSLSGLNDERTIRQIDQYHLDLSSIIGIDSPRSIEYRDAVLDRQSTTRTHLPLITYGDSHRQSCRYELTLHRLQRQRGLYICPQIQSRRLLRSVLWQIERRMIDYLDRDLVHNYSLRPLEGSTQRPSALIRAISWLTASSVGIARRSLSCPR